MPPSPELLEVWPTVSHADEVVGVGKIDVVIRAVLAARLAATGASNRTIADTLFISVRTAGIHVSRILAKLGVANRGSAVARALSSGVIEPTELRPG